MGIIKLSLHGHQGSLIVNLGTSAAGIRKKSSNPVYGQVDKTAPQQNSSDGNKKWNFHFILGMKGELVQVWTRERNKR